METRQWFRKFVGVMAVTIAPILGGIGWKFSPGKEAFLGALAFWPVLVLGTLISALISVVLYYKRTVHCGALLVPGAVLGAMMFCFFLNLDYRSEWAALTSESGMRGIIYEDSSGEFGSDYVFAVERADGELVGEVFLDWHYSPDEAHYRLCEVKGQLQVVEAADAQYVIAWYSPKSDRVLSYRGN